MKWFVRVALTMLPLLMTSAGCGGRQSAPPAIETRPLEEGKAASIIEEVLSERGYAAETDVAVRAARTTEFRCDYRAKGEAIAIEFLTEKDRQAIGPIPGAAEGSRLHVLSGTASSKGATGGSSQVYILFLDDRDFTYHANPTSETRADVTFLEVDSRLRRDLADFLSWYEETRGKE
jgi:hypothetical protein